MTLLAPLGLLAGLVAVPVLLMHVLRPRRTRHEVSSLFLWQEITRPVAASQPWQRLRFSLLLLLQLLVVALLALALARPARGTETTLAEHTVFIFDTSASMQATDIGADRLDAAKERAQELFDQLPPSGVASVVVASASPEILLAESGDSSGFAAALAQIRATSGRVDFDRAFTLAESLASADRPTGFVLLSDGGLNPNDIPLAPAGTRFESIGRASDNRAVASLVVVPTSGGLEALVTVTNTGGPAATQTLRVDVDGATVERREVELGSGSSTEVAVPIPPGSQVEAFLEGEDLLLLDNRRVALSPVERDIEVRVESSRNPFFLEQVLDALGATQVTDPRAEVDVVVYDGVPVPPDAATPYVALASTDPPQGIALLGEVERPVPTLVVSDPVLRDVDLSRVSIASAQSLAVEGGEVLVAAERTPLLVAGRTGATSWYYLGFELEQSNMALTVGFPLLMSRLISALTVGDDVPASLEVGSRPESLPHPVELTSPLGVRQAVDAGAPMPVLDRPGFWLVESAEHPSAHIAANVPRAEMDLAPAAELDGLPAAPNALAGTSSATVTSSLVPLVLIVLLAVIVLELAVSWRQIGVSRWQWRAGLVVRALLVALLVAALLDPTIGRSNDDVRVALVVDVSDSLGPGGAAQVQAFVDAVRRDASIDSLAIVEVGREAVVTQPFGAEAPVRATAETDATALARGVRLAASLLDGSSRERVVVVSDGRADSAEMRAEVERLTTAGVVVDVHTVDPPPAGDVAVAGVETPGHVADNERFTLVANITASVATTKNIEVRVEDRPLQSRTVDLAPGENQVAFDIEAGDPGVERYEVVVADATDTVPENDRVFAAVVVSGPPKVFVAGRSAELASDFAAILDARGLEVTDGPVSELPAADAMNEYTTVVLIDVAARELGAGQIDALDSFVRTQGRGLVVIGGDNSYALGGYSDTPLEELLPVLSEVQDPKRRATVAEVLLIDTSESMGACHCAPVDGGSDPFGGEAIEGGVNKTDISRSAAARAIEALSANDEVGVLAFNGSQQWIIPLQSLPSEQVITQGLGSLRPRGETRISPALDAAAEQLRESSKELKHIILFSDGFTPELLEGFVEEFGPGGPQFGDVVEQAAALAEEGITVSVVGTGEGAAQLLQAVAEAGNGRFYPGRDLSEIPEIFVQEARLASRDFVNEGEHLPAVTSTAPPVRDLEAAPVVLGYVATTPKDTADVMLQVGPLADPLLASWRVGLGRVTAWTSDSGERWASPWAAWSDNPDFWAAVIQDTFPLEGASGNRLQATIIGHQLEIVLESEDPWPAGSDPVAQVAAPDGSLVEVELERRDETTFVAAAPAPDAGSYSVGVSGEAGGAVASTLATRSYPIEYLPDAPEVDLEALSVATGGRGQVSADQVFDADGLQPGRDEVSLRWWLMLAAVLLWPLDIAIRRLRLPDSWVSTLRRARPRGSSPLPRPTPS